jgi:hypothetical protein
VAALGRVAAAWPSARGGRRVAGPKGGTGLNGRATWAGSGENGSGLAREIELKLIWAVNRNMNCFLN